MTGDGPGARIALLGNVANCLVPLAVALRDAGYDADLFVEDDAPLTERPETTDPALRDATWVRRGAWFSARHALVPWRAPVVAELRRYDLTVVTGAGPVFAQWSGRPVCWWASGGDLTVTPFPWAFRRTYASRARRLGAYPLALWQRRAARRAAEIWVQPFAPFRDAVRRLGLGSPPVSSRYLPLVLDPEPWRRPDPAARSAALDEVAERMARADLAVLHPSRVLIRTDAAVRRSGQWKGTDTLVRGFAELVRRGHAADPLLVIPDTTASRDLPEARHLVDELGIGAHVLWARPPRAEGFTRPELAHLYAAADVVADEFGAGWFGYVTLEGLAVGRPVIARIDEDAMAVLYPEGHPVVAAPDEGGIADALTGLLDPDRRRVLGDAGRRWVDEHHAPGAAGRRYVEAITAALTRVSAGAAG